MAPNGDNFRGVHAVELLNKAPLLGIDQIIQLGYDSHLAAFDVLIPALVRASQQVHASTDARLDSAVQLLATWDHKSSVSSVATTIAIEWAQRIWPTVLRPIGENDFSDLVEKHIVLHQ